MPTPDATTAAALADLATQAVASFALAARATPSQSAAHLRAELGLTGEAGVAGRWTASVDRNPHFEAKHTMPSSDLGACKRACARGRYTAFTVRDGVAVFVSNDRAACLAACNDAYEEAGTVFYVAPAAEADFEQNAALPPGSEAAVAAVTARAAEDLAEYERALAQSAADLPPPPPAAVTVASADDPDVAQFLPDGISAGRILAPSAAGAARLDDAQIDNFVGDGDGDGDGDNEDGGAAPAFVVRSAVPGRAPVPLSENDAQGDILAILTAERAAGRGGDDASSSSSSSDDDVDFDDVSVSTGGLLPDDAGADADADAAAAAGRRGLRPGIMDRDKGDNDIDLSVARRPPPQQAAPPPPPATSRVSLPGAPGEEDDDYVLVNAPEEGGEGTAAAVAAPPIPAKATALYASPDAAPDRRQGDGSTQDEVSPFKLDPSFDYDNCPLTPAVSTKQMLEEWEAGRGVPVDARASAGARASVDEELALT